jgi:4-hydroxybenzoate polyprenyltransferase
MFSDVIRRARTYAAFVRFSHSVFALPFALVGAILAARTSPGALTWTRLGWIAACMVTARSAAMGFNRLVDARHDARNPRTAGRELPKGRMTRAEAIGFVVIASIAFIFCASRLGALCLALSPIALVIVFWYSLAKRYTSYTQMFLGLAMAVAPIGGWFAAGGRTGSAPWLLGLAIGTWVGGFDVLYACQDLDVDLREGLHSIPVRFGVSRSLLISRIMHVIAVLSLAMLGVTESLGRLYFAGVVGVGALLIWEQSLVAADDLSQVKRAFDMNGWVGILYLAMTAAAVYWR